MPTPFNSEQPNSARQHLRGWMWISTRIFGYPVIMPHFMTYDRSSMVTQWGRNVHYGVNYTIVLHKCVARFVSDSWVSCSIFTTRRYVYKRGLCCGLDRRPSVRPSVTSVDCVRTAQYIVKLLCPLDSLITLVFWPPALSPNSMKNPFNGGTKYKG